MAFISQSKTTEFKINRDDYKVVEIQLGANIHLGIVLCVRQRWGWKEDIFRIESDIVQFTGISQSDVRAQCTEWVRITASPDFTIAFDADLN